jgi:hydrogenase nickel incorporation protein HypA/HybF
MHEFAITKCLFDIVLNEAGKAGATRVTGINLVLGELTGVVKESVQFYLEYFSRNTPAEGASLNVKYIPAKAKCYECGYEFEIAEGDWLCPGCRNFALEIVTGKELFLESIDVE